MREKPRFYREPTGQEVEEYGPFIAEARQQVRARKLGSRLMSAGLAVGMGSANTILMILFASESVNLKTVAGSFAVPALANTIAQIRTEQTQRRDLRHLSQVADEIIDHYESHLLRLETHQADD